MPNKPELSVIGIAIVSVMLAVQVSKLPPPLSASAREATLRCSGLHGVLGHRSDGVDRWTCSVFKGDPGSDTPRDVYVFTSAYLNQ